MTEASPADAAVTLAAPIEHDGATYSRMKLRPLTVGDLADVEESSGGEMRKAALLISLLAGVPLAVALKLGMKDFAALSGQLAKEKAALGVGESAEDGEPPSP